MQFEQPAELNKYIDTTIPLTWTVRWRAVKPVLPILVCCSVLFVERVAFQLWLNDRSLVSELPLLLVCSLFPVTLVLLAFEAQVRLTHRSKRKITLQPKRILISPAKYTRIAYKQVSRWRLEPLAGAPELTKLTLEYSFGRKSKLQREWSMVLRKTDQEHQFLSELELLRQMNSSAAPVVRLPEPFVLLKPQRRLRSMVAVAVGLYLLLHGFPLLLASVIPPTGHSDPSPSESRFSAKETAKLRRTVSRSFSSPQQFRIFVLVTGSTLTTLGGVLYFWGLSSKPAISDEMSSVILCGRQQQRMLQDRNS